MPVTSPLPIAAAAALRLVRKQNGRAAPRVPFGLARFHEDGEGLALVLDVPSGWSSADGGDLATLVAQIPPATSLAPDTLVLVLADADREAGLLTRILGAGKVTLPRALRTSALLARGYADIGAGVDAASGLDLAWGYARALAAGDSDGTSDIKDATRVPNASY